MSEVDRDVIHVISDSSGETAERVARSALVQFANANARIVKHTRVRELTDLQSIFRTVEKDALLVLYTLVNPALREALVEMASEHGVECIDPLGGVIAKVGSLLGKQPEGRPGGLQSLDEAYFKRIEAVEFTVKHDDGQMPQGLRKADVVIVGISRTSKTPVCTYLAQKGIRAANVPIVLGIPLPRELFEVDPSKVFALTINVASLVRIRRARLKQLNMSPDSDYGMREHIIKELKYAREIFRDNPSWPVVDVSQKALEETSSIITWMCDERAAGEPMDGLDRFSGPYSE
jgi:regulator of PEP synthase PpsR (kinase-PPPase family)